ncbi:DUF899-domain-containing protein, partial [Ascobolus immersus RN42]
QVVGRSTWLYHRRALLEKEKALTHALDNLAKERRALPWVELSPSTIQTYTFLPTTTPNPDWSQAVTLSDLFQGRKQLIVYHFMFPPQPEDSTGCPGCSGVLDHLPLPSIKHMQDRDTTLIITSRASPALIHAHKTKLGWGSEYPWFHITPNSPFNIDMGVTLVPNPMPSPEFQEEEARFYNFSQTPYEHSQRVSRFGQVTDNGVDMNGVSVFYKDENMGRVYHTYTTHSRGVQLLQLTEMFLDLTPLGRQDEGVFRYKLHFNY